MKQFKYIKWKEATNKQKKVRLLDVGLYTISYLTSLYLITGLYTLPALNTIADFLSQNINNFKPGSVTVEFAIYFLIVVSIGTLFPTLGVMYLTFKYKWWTLKVLRRFNLDPGVVEKL